MMRTTGFILLGLSAFFYFGRKAAKNIVDSIVVKFSGFRLIEYTIQGLTINLYVSIYNPLYNNIYISDIVGDIYLMEQMCAIVDYPINQTLHKRANSNLTLQFKISNSELAKALYDNIMTGSIENLKMRFDGYLRVQNIKIPIDREFTYKEIKQ